MIAERKIRIAIAQTLVIKNPESIDIAINKIIETCKVNEMEAALKRIYLSKHFIGLIPTNLVTEIESLLQDLQS